jgi:uncharacterized repeat protein (TIGR03803 family)
MGKSSIRGWFAMSFALGLFASLGLATASRADTPFTTIDNFCSIKDCADGAEPTGPLAIDKKGDLFAVGAEGGASDSGVAFMLTPNKSNASYTATKTYDFCSTSGKKVACTDGVMPIFGLVIDDSGDLFGMAEFGGANGQGAVFRLSFDKAKKKYGETVLYSFCPSHPKVCGDGQQPAGGLIMDGKGNLFGVTGDGGKGGGVVYELAFDRKKNTYTETVLYTFCSQNVGQDCSDGQHPFGRLTLDASGNLYGVTTDGGTSPGDGVVFELKRTGSHYTETVLYTFCLVQDMTGCTDAASPNGSLVLDQGSIYGTAQEGGANDAGAVFRLSLNAGEYALTTIHGFCTSQGADTCADGARPIAGIFMDVNGRLFGTASAGGTGSDPGSGAGTAFELTEVAHTGTYAFSVLHTFCPAGPNPVCLDGELPFGELILDKNDNLFGATVLGGTQKHGIKSGAGGTVFQLGPVTP